MPKCRYCQEQVVWVKRPGRNAVTVNAETFHGELQYEPDKHQIHLLNCAAFKKHVEKNNAAETVYLTNAEKKKRGLI